MATAQTAGIRVTVESRHLPEKSAPGRFLFAYDVRIANEGPVPAQLLSRHWIITDALGREEHVEGPGVIGEQPTIPPGAVHQYQSFCPLPSPLGSMRGTYRMMLPDGTLFDAEIPEFALTVPARMN